MKLHKMYKYLKFILKEPACGTAPPSPHPLPPGRNCATQNVKIPVMVHSRLISPFLVLRCSIMLQHNWFLVICALLSLAVPVLVAAETCPAGMPGMPGMFMHVCIPVFMYLYICFVLFVYLSFHPQVFPGCLAGTVVTVREDRRDSQVSNAHWTVKHRVIEPYWPYAILPSSSLQPSHWRCCLCFRVI